MQDVKPAWQAWPCNDSAFIFFLVALPLAEGAAGVNFSRLSTCVMQWAAP